MIEAQLFLESCLGCGVRFVAGVPCSNLAPLINCLLSQSAISYLGATNEGEAVALAVGAALTGIRTAVICQNSGLGNMVNPLTSLCTPFRVPLLLVSTWRGRPGTNDEPQHRIMGAITTPLLDLLGVAHEQFPTTADGLDSAIANAIHYMDHTRRSYCFVMAGDALAPVAATAGRARPTVACESIDLRESVSMPTRVEILRALLELAPRNAAIVATTGKSGRELFTLSDREQHFYLVGSMGFASAVGLGVALHTPGPVVVVDGDGAALMHLGNLATIGSHAPGNLLHVLLDNGAYDSTGGQPTASADFATIARGAGYRVAVRCNTVRGFRKAFAELATKRGPILLHVQIASGSLPVLGRPTVEPHEVARRFSAFLQRQRRASQPEGEQPPSVSASGKTQNHGRRAEMLTGGKK